MQAISTEPNKREHCAMQSAVSLGFCCVTGNLVSLFRVQRENRPEVRKLAVQVITEPQA